MAIQIYILNFFSNSAYTLVVLNKYIAYDVIMDLEREIYSNIGANIRKYRLEKHLSQEKLSELLDANSKFIGHVERIERFISLKKLIQLSKLLDVSIEKFFEKN